MLRRPRSALRPALRPALRLRTPHRFQQPELCRWLSVPAKRDEDQGKVERAQGIAHKGGALLGRGIGALKRRADQYHVIEEAGKMKDKVGPPNGTPTTFA